MTLQDWAHVGEVASGGGTLLALGLAWHQLGRWRSERREEKRSEAAAEAVVALHAACDACHEWAALLAGEAGEAAANPDRTHGELYQGLENAFENGRRLSEQPMKQLRLAEVRALIYMQEFEYQSIRKVQSEAFQIDLLFRDAMVSMRHKLANRTQVLPDLQDSLSVVAKELTSIRAEGTQDLTRVAQLNPPSKRLQPAT
jgi:hypothetical protein